MRWSEIDFRQKEWHIPNTKNGTAQVLSLDDGANLMIGILERRKQESKSDWVFPGDGSTGHLAEPRKGWVRLLNRARRNDIIGMIAEKYAWTDEEIRLLKELRVSEAIGQLESMAKALHIDISRAGLLNLRSHDLRRTLGSWMAGTGASTLIIGKVLNHKSEAATRIYSRLDKKPVIQARNRAIEEILGAATNTSNKLASLVEQQAKDGT